MKKINLCKVIVTGLFTVGILCGCATENTQTRTPLAHEDPTVNIEETTEKVEETTDEEKDAPAESEDIVNSLPVVLTPVEGEFLAENEDYEIVRSSEGDWYGYSADYWGGCSVWCVIEEFEESAVASSVLAPQGNHTYVAENIISHNRRDAWVEGVDGYGIGEYISISKRYKRSGDEYGISFTDLCIVNGMAKDERLWKANSRVKTLKMYFNEEYVCDLELLDTMKPQYFSLKGLLLWAANNENSVFKFEIVDVYKGDVYEDTVLTGIEIEFSTPNH